MYMWQTLLNQRPTAGGKPSGWRSLLGICCILLLIVGASAELNHFHASGGVHSDCSLCVTAHSVAQASVATVAPVVLRPVADCADPEPLFVRRSLDIRLSIRPPPVAPELV
jgi:hypothetical protein